MAAWPPSLPSTGFAIDAQSPFGTIVWGTDGFQNTGGIFASYIIKSVRPSVRTDTPIVENGDGLTAIQIVLTDGYDYEIVVVDNTAVTPPQPGFTVKIVLPDNVAVVAGLVIHESYAAARKVEGERTFTIRTYTLIPLTASS